MSVEGQKRRFEPAAGPAMSASHPKRPSAMKMRSVAKGQQQTSERTLRQRRAASRARFGSIFLKGVWRKWQSASGGRMEGPWAGQCDRGIADN